MEILPMSRSAGQEPKEELIIMMTM